MKKINQTRSWKIREHKLNTKSHKKFSVSHRRQQAKMDAGTVVIHRPLAGLIQVPSIVI